MERMSESLAVALRKARGERSQAEFARFLGFEHQATYQRYEQGRIPDADVLYQMANRLGVTMEQLLTGGEIGFREGENLREEFSVWKRRAQEAERNLDNLRKGLRSLLELSSPNPLPEELPAMPRSESEILKEAVSDAQHDEVVYSRKKK